MRNAKGLKGVIDGKDGKDWMCCNFAMSAALSTLRSGDGLILPSLSLDRGKQFLFMPFAIVSLKRL